MEMLHYVIQHHTIFIDGRPTTLTLDQIPADEIESVEIITNPSAKFDASGGGSGILILFEEKQESRIQWKCKS